MSTSDLSLTFLGGLGDIGRNCAVLESDDAALLIDCGIMFPNVDMPGVDVVLPDFSYLRDLKKPIAGCVITHGHEDHHGALAFLVADRRFPIFGSAFSLALARRRLEEVGLDEGQEFVVVDDGQQVDVGPFGVEFIPVAHSVPAGFAIAIRHGGTTILHTGDWKLDLTPIDGRRTDLARIAAISRTEGIDLLLADSTNADEPGYCESEAVIQRTIRDLFQDNQDSRIIVACFASHLHRVQQVIEAAVAQGRTIATLGMSMRRNVDLAVELGLLSDIPDRVDISEIRNYESNQVCVLATGSQGEPMSALALMASGRSRWLDIQPNDVVIFSTTAISGNEHGVARVMDGLTRRGATVIHSGFANVHTSGHAKQEDLKLMLSLADPRYFIPVHGEHRHLAAHAQLAASLGWSESRVVRCEDGSQVRITSERVTHAGTVPARYVYVDRDIGPVGGRTLRDRSTLAETGVLSITVCIESSGVVTVRAASTGWVDPDSREGLHKELEAVLLQRLKAKLRDKMGKDMDLDEGWLRRETKSAASSLAGGVPTLMTTILQLRERSKTGDV